MSARNSPVAAAPPRRVTVTRLFDLPRATVFEAWTSAEHLKHWFAPAGYTVSLCTVDFRIGGTWTLGLRAPDGREMRARGTFTEIVAPARIVFTDAVLDDHDAPRFEVLTTVTFDGEQGHTRLTVVVDVIEVFDPRDANIAARMDTGWRQTVEKLARHIAGRRDDA